MVESEIIKSLFELIKTQPLYKKDIADFELLSQRRFIDGLWCGMGTKYYLTYRAWNILRQNYTDEELLEAKKCMK